MPTLSQLVGPATRTDLLYAFPTPQSVAGCDGWYSLLDTLGYVVASTALTALLDRSGNSRDMTSYVGGKTLNLVAGPTSTTKAVVASAPASTPSYISVPNGSAAVRDGNQAFSAHLIFKQPGAWPSTDTVSLAGAGVLYSYLSDTGGFYVLTNREGSDPYKEFVMFNVTSAVTPAHKVSVRSADLNYGQVYAIAITYDGSGTAAGVNIYINGTLSAMTTLSDTLGGESIKASGSTFFLGSGSEFNNNQSPISDVAFFSRVLSAPDIALLHTYAQTYFAVS